MINIALRSDIQMPLGKKIAQSAHALCAYQLGLYDKALKSYRIDRSLMQQLLAKAKNVEASLEDIVNSKIKIIDAGHTVFNGQATLTAGILTDNWSNYIENEHSITNSTNVRMVMCSTKNIRKSLGKDYFQIAVNAYAKHLDELLFAQNLSIDESKWLDIWCSGSFAKIALEGSLEQISNLADDSKKVFRVSKIMPGIYVAGPAPLDELKPFTGAMRLL